MRNASLTYRPVLIDDAPTLLSWRTDPAVSRYMLTEIEPDIRKQQLWIAQSNDRDDLVHRVIQLAGTDIGYCSIKTTDPIAGTGTIGIYIGEASAPTSLTAFNFIHILNHAFYRLRLHKIVNHILASNDRLVPAQKFNGYSHVGTLKDHVLKDGVRLDMHIFEQTAADWSIFRKKFQDWRDLDGTSWPDELAAFCEVSFAS